MSRVLLGLNIDHVATLRNARGENYPDPIYAAYIAENAGVDSITVHLREDRRHIQDRDVKLLVKTVHTFLNLEMAATDEMVNLACMLRPHFCCLVPEKRQEITTEGGLDVFNQKEKLKYLVSKLINAGVRVSIFINPDEKQIFSSYQTGVSHIELNTGLYAEEKNEEKKQLELKRIEDAVNYATNYGLKVNAGHGLNYNNVNFVAQFSLIKELNIGHAIISRAVFCGLYRAVRDMKELLRDSREKE